jgi:hypothetical protein
MNNADIQQEHSGINILLLNLSPALWAKVNGWFLNRTNVLFAWCCIYVRAAVPGYTLTFSFIVERELKMLVTLPTRLLLM